MNEKDSTPVSVSAAPKKHARIELVGVVFGKDWNTILVDTESWLNVPQDTKGRTYYGVSIGWPSWVKLLMKESGICKRDSKVFEGMLDMAEAEGESASSATRGGEE